MIDRLWRLLADRWWARADLDLSRIGLVDWVPRDPDAARAALAVAVGFGVPLRLVDPWPGYVRWPGLRLLDLLPVFRAERGGIRFVVPPTP